MSIEESEMVITALIVLSGLREIQTAYRTPTREVWDKIMAAVRRIRRWYMPRLGSVKVWFHITSWPETTESARVSSIIDHGVRK